MYAELVINVEAGLSGTFHYHVPRDLESQLAVGHLVEVEFGRRLAQGIVIAFSDSAPVDETKPIVAIIESEPVVAPWQIDLAKWLSHTYVSPLNGALRLMLPPGLTRWADLRVDVNPYWPRDEELTEKQARLVALLDDRGALRSRQLSALFGKKKEWQPVVDQLVRKNVLRRASVLDPPRARPKTVQLVELAADLETQLARAAELGSASKKADILLYLVRLVDPLPLESAVLDATGARASDMQALNEEQLIWRSPAHEVLVDEREGGTQEQPAAIVLNIDDRATLEHVLTFRRGRTYFIVLDHLATEGRAIVVGDLYAATGAASQHIKRLAELGLVRVSEEQVWRDPLADRDFVPSDPPQLTADQDRVWEKLLELDESASESKKPILLHGVTGSGKTEIYLRLIERALQRGQQAIVLVPEIALTPQTVRRFASRFPGRVAMVHSRLSDGERYDTWRRAREGLFDIVVGPRSALFTPFANIGAIVIDEEHDASYKHSAPVPPPYYHARETAIEIGRQTGATVLMGSATPDIVTYHRALGGQIELLELPKRVMGHRRRLEGQAQRLQAENRYHHRSEDPDDAFTIPLPPVSIVDLRQELRAGNRSIFSRLLADAITETLDRGEQAILFINRRGTASFVICRDCGHVLNCPNCGIPLTYHRPNMALICHQCGYHEARQDRCPNCNSKRIRHFGLGTEEVEARVQQRWPKARITRWDRDTTAGKDKHEELLASFINHESDILVGTQMIAKGLDLPLVTLVGVISADVALGLPDFRTGERAFQVLAQVAGRAGRGLLGGRVIFQTYQPQHYAIQAAAEHDYQGFFVEEMSFRTQHMLPPFRRMAKLITADPIADRAKREAQNLASKVRELAKEQALGATQILGPVPPYFNRIDGRYRWQIIIRSPDPAPLLRDLAVPRSWIVDVDPVSTL